jgi:hypothetical protein
VVLLFDPRYRSLPEMPRFSIVAFNVARGTPSREAAALVAAHLARSAQIPKITACSEVPCQPQRNECPAIYD